MQGVCRASKVAAQMEVNIYGAALSLLSQRSGH